MLPLGPLDRMASAEKAMEERDSLEALAAVQVLEAGAGGEGARVSASRQSSMAEEESGYLRPYHGSEMTVPYEPPPASAQITTSTRPHPPPCLQWRTV